MASMTMLQSSLSLTPRTSVRQSARHPARSKSLRLVHFFRGWTVSRKCPAARARGTILTLSNTGGAMLLTSVNPVRAAVDLENHNIAISDLALGLDSGVQALYLTALLALLATGTFLVVRQILVRRELETTAKEVGDRVRSGAATGEEFFELGVVLLRKKSYTQAIKNLERALESWDGEPEEKAQAYNALGYALFMQEKHSEAAANYRMAVELQAGYVTAWNNLGNAYEKLRQPEAALEAYEETLSYAPDNEIAKQRVQMIKARLERLSSY